MSKVYSPSQSKNYLQCPMKWLLSKRGWIPKTYGKSSLYAMRGAAVSSGLELFCKGKDLNEVRTVVLETLDKEWEKNKIDKREWNEFKSLPLERHEVANQALLLVQAYVNTPCTAYSVMHSEYTFKEHGWARADLIGKLIPSGKILPIDFKSKDVPTQTYYMHQTKMEFKNDWQLLHYRWATNEEFQVEEYDYGIVLLWFDKKCKVEYAPYIVEPERLKLWLESARQVWADMEAIELGNKLPYESAHHKTQFGYCEFLSMCLTHNRNETQAALDYFNIKR